MQDAPSPADLATAVADFLRKDILPSLSHHLAFQTRVAINALDLIARQSALEAPFNAGEADRLRALLGETDALVPMNAALAARIANGAVDLETPGLADHLWATTLEKLAVDQPNYGAYRAEIAKEAAREPQ